MIIIKNNEIYSNASKIIHRRGTHFYGWRMTLLPGDTAAMFEEVDEIPILPSADYGKRVEELIREHYTVSDELAILRQRDTKPEEFAEYFAFCEKCKKEARQWT